MKLVVYPELFWNFCFSALAVGLLTFQFTRGALLQRKTVEILGPHRAWVSLTGHLEEKVFLQLPWQKIAPLFFPIRALRGFSTQPSLPWGGISLNCTGKAQTHHFIIRVLFNVLPSTHIWERERLFQGKHDWSTFLPLGLGVGLAVTKSSEDTVK